MKIVAVVLAVVTLAILSRPAAKVSAEPQITTLAQLCSHWTPGATLAMVGWWPGDQSAMNYLVDVVASDGSYQRLALLPGIQAVEVIDGLSPGASYTLYLHQRMTNGQWITSLPVALATTASCSPGTGRNLIDGSTYAAGWVVREPTPAASSPSARSSGEADCHSSYRGVCLKVNSGDYDCSGGSGDGPNFIEGPFAVIGPDQFELDDDDDTTACE